MRSALALAAMAIICAAGHPSATTTDVPFTGRAPRFGLVLFGGQNTGIAWNGKWQGTTVSGHQLVLDLQVQGQRMKGRLTVNKQSANIIDGKVVGDSLTTGPIDGHKVGGKGRHTGDAIEFTIDGVKEPLTLTRVK